MGASNVAGKNVTDIKWKRSQFGKNTRLFFSACCVLLVLLLLPKDCGHVEPRASTGRCCFLRSVMCTATHPGYLAG